MDAPFKASDLSDAIRHIQAPSAPGMDGLAAPFYQAAP
uniref:Uncharacterized protein n=1 Tax=Peronospora matthiolae TaxID=2874970 RepID=A0AAV1T7W1_9STRA